MRTRTLQYGYDPVNIYLGRNRYYKPNGTLYLESSMQFANTYGADRLLDQCVDETHPGPPYRTGGPLTITHFSNMDIPLEGQRGRHYIGGPYYGYYEGDYWIPSGLFNDGNYVPPEMANWNTSSLSSLGATGWKKFQPGKPTAGLTVFLAELRELPSLLKESTKLLKELATNPSRLVRNMSLRNSGSRYLAYQFGWAPLVRDLQKFYKTAQKLDEAMNRLRKNNGKWRRRGGTIFSDGTTVVSSGGADIFPQPMTASMPPEGVTHGYTTKEWGCEAWFEAVMKYYIPNFESVETRDRLRRRLFGLEITPAAVWELIPWSWLVDWVSNVGDVIANMTPIDNLVAKYAYVMRHSWVTYTRSGSQRYASDPSRSVFHTVSGTTIQKWEKKERAVASPFGFGLTEQQFSARQWAILAALGFQKFR